MPSRDLVDKLGGLTFTPLGPSEMPLRRGTPVAIDAEFVAVSREETRLGPRGQTVVVKPARLALARVSCIRGEGSMAGVPFLDSCIMQARSRRDLAEITPRYRRSSTHA